MTARRNSAVFVWSDRAIFLGDRSETAVHAHHAIELCVALDELGVHMSSPEGPALCSAPAALVRSDARHQLSIPGPKVAVLYVDPHAPVAAGLERWLGQRSIRALSEDDVRSHRARLRRLFQPDTGIEDAARACDALVATIAPTPDRPEVDERVRRVLTFLSDQLDDPPTQAEAARHAGLSPSRLGHLFKDQVGLPMRHYILWMRLRRALTEALAGASMTEAAHLAGFSDAAHFTRTCQRMFGLPPTAFSPVDAVFVQA